MNGRELCGLNFPENVVPEVAQDMPYALEGICGRAMITLLPHLGSHKTAPDHDAFIAANSHRSGRLPAGDCWGSARQRRFSLTSRPRQGEYRKATRSLRRLPSSRRRSAFYLAPPPCRAAWRSRMLGRDPAVVGTVRDAYSATPGRLVIPAPHAVWRDVLAEGRALAVRSAADKISRGKPSLRGCIGAHAHVRRAAATAAVPARLRAFCVCSPRWRTRGRSARERLCAPAYH